MPHQGCPVANGYPGPARQHAGKKDWDFPPADIQLAVGEFRICLDEIFDLLLRGFPYEKQIVMAIGDSNRGQ